MLFSPNRGVGSVRLDLISTFLERATTPGFGQKVLRQLAWLVFLWIIATLVVCPGTGTPFWVVMLLALFSALSASLYLIAYAYCHFGRKRKTAPRWEYLRRYSAGRVYGEDQGLTSGARYWFGRDLMRTLGYETWEPFADTIHRAIDICATLEISVADNFSRTRREINGWEYDDFELSAFACCLTALNGDTKKARVAAAQAFLQRSDQRDIGEVVSLDIERRNR
jgi:hypothetical protein